MIKIDEKDNVAVSFSDGHKRALTDIRKGDAVVKYGFPIGVATADIKAGERVHTHNLMSAISEESDYVFTPKAASNFAKNEGDFLGYLRADGSVGIRNEIWIINTVGCTNKASEKIAEAAKKTYAEMTGEILAITHPYGCSQLGDDHENTRKILVGMARHPNAGGVLILGLGCENNSVCEFKNFLGNYDEKRIKFLVAQDCENEVEAGVKLIGEIADTIRHDKREKVNLDKLVIGLKCGGSDAFSGITANPLAGRISDRLNAHGGTVIMTETPEMFGAETILMSRCIDENIFNKTVSMVNNFKKYFTSHGQQVYENPSPGNKAGGITTLEEKSLGCVQKGGTGAVSDVLAYGERAKIPGLNLLDGPGNDIVSTTALTAAGCHLILFTTGRGTPLGAFAPTIKITSNCALAEKKANWTDYDAGELLSGKGFDEAEEELWDLIIAVAEGRIQTKSELNDYREFAIFKNGVTL
jgi:altronate hydrolase